MSRCRSRSPARADTICLLFTLLPSAHPPIPIFKPRRYSLVPSYTIRKCRSMDQSTVHKILYHPLRDSAADETCTKPSNTWGIRLITLFPGNPDSSIHCSLSYSTLGKCDGAFEALSYTWGDPTSTALIKIDGLDVMVTKNLETALRCLRRETPRQLWIDAVCINQTDLTEKNIQVARMWAVYTHASQATVFLGEDYEESDKAVGLLHAVGELKTQANDTIASWIADRNRKAAWQALEKLFRRQWWRRSWIIQEYAVAREIMFICGDISLDGTKFEFALQNLVEYRFNGTVPEEMAYLVRHVAYTPIHHLLSIRLEYQRNKRPEQQAIGVLYKFRGSQASDPRDKVFSLHKLMDENPLLVPDYNQPVSLVYKSVVQAAISS